MPKKHNSNKDVTQKVDKNRPKSKSEKKEEQKKHKLAVSMNHKITSRSTHDFFFFL